MSTQPTISDQAPFLAGGGEMGERMRAVDWSKTSLGPVATWPQSLRSPLSMMLPSKAQIILFWGPEYVVFYNDAYRPVFGAKHPQVLGQPGRVAWSEIWETGANLRGLLEGVVRTGEAFAAKDLLFVLERHGFVEETYFDVSYDPVRVESGEVGGVYCIVTETTGRVVGERRLALLKDLAARNATARSAREACTLAMETLAAKPHDIPFAAAYLDGELQAKTLEEQPQFVLELTVGTTGRLVVGLNRQRPFDEQYRSFVDLIAGQLATAIANARAYEEERKRAEALAEIDRAKTAFFSNVSHEFRTPLTLILGPLEEALAESTEGSQRERLELLYRNALRLQKLVNTLLDFSRLEAGRIQAAYEPTNLAELTGELASVFRSAVEKAGMRLIVNCPPLGEPVYVDREMYEKVVLNLLSNAFKFTLDGEIEVTLRDAGAAVELTVRDTGTGIASDQLPHIFERFHRVEGARARTHEGTGIGLAFVQELVKLHGGTVSVRSVAGEGSTFTVSIPKGNGHLPADRIGTERKLASTALAADHYVQEALRWLPGDTPAALSTPASRPAVGRAAADVDGPPRIVWADDNADMRDYVGRLLGPLYDVEAVADGEAALAAVQREKPDLVLADVMMPQLDGFGLLRALRADDRTSTIPVILLSARAGEEAQIEGMAAGADDYVVKPFSARELLARVGTHLEMARLRRESEHAVRESEARFRHMADNAPVMVWVTESDGSCSYLSKSWYEFTGQTPATGLGFGWMDAVHPDDRARTHETLLSASALREAFRLEYRLRRKDGQYRWAINAAVPRTAADGQSLGYIGSVIDITERKKVESALASSELRYRTLFDAIDEGFCIVEFLDGPHGPLSDYVHIEANPAYARHTGIPNVVGQRLREMVPAEADDWLARYRPVLETGQPIRFEQTLVATGRRLELAAFRVEPPELRQVAVLFSDVTARWKAEEQLRQYAAELSERERRKDEFLAMLAHELRNPLAAIHNAGQILLRADADGESLRSAAQILNRQVGHMVRQVDDLLDVSRISRGKIELRKEPTELARVVNHALEASRPVCETLGHELTVTLPPKPIYVHGDAIRLAQVVGNLLNNACKFTEKGGHIWLTVEQEGGRAVIRVRDNGIGIAASELPRIFEMFAQVDRSLERARDGLGLGLTLVKNLVEMHDGTVEAHSAGLGRGSEFVVRLPLLPGPQRPQARGPSGVKPVVAVPRRVLVVDDNRDSAATLAILLKRMGHEVDAAYDGLEAVEKAATFRADVILLDIGMPRLNGYEAARRIREQGQEGLTLVALTGWGQEEDRRLAKEAGFDAHLVKPIDLTDLTEILAETGGG